MNCKLKCVHISTTSNILALATKWPCITSPNLGPLGRNVTVCPGRPCCPRPRLPVKESEACLSRQTTASCTAQRELIVFNHSVVTSWTHFYHWWYKVKEKAALTLRDLDNVKMNTWNYLRQVVHIFLYLILWFFYGSATAAR